MKTFPNWLICEHCDSLYVRHALAPNEVARCRRCEAVLCRGGQPDLDRHLALTVATAIVFVIANVCPVMRISLQDLHREATLWQSAAALAQGGAAPIALPAALALVAAPCMQICLLAWILAYAKAGRHAPGFAPAMRVLVAIRPWSMVEVGLLGILVAVIKLVGFVQVAPGAGIWAMAALMLLLPVVAGRDLHALWDMRSRAGEAA